MELVDTSRATTYSCLEKKTEADPLIIPHKPPLIRVDGLVNAGVRHVDPDSFPEGTWNSVGAVDPAEGVENILRVENVNDIKNT